ncbi:hypothetical protein [Hydrogenophaga sp.]
MREALDLQGVPIGNMVDRQTRMDRILKAQMAWQSACTPYAIKWLFDRAALATKPQAGDVAQDKIDAERWRAFIGLEYKVRAEWACNLSLVPVLTEWVDQRAARTRGEGSQP